MREVAVERLAVLPDGDQARAAVAELERGIIAPTASPRNPNYPFVPN